MHLKFNDPFVVYAHRGASEYAPENTMSAFYLGVSQGANGIETDIRRTKDGVLVLFHDRDLTRVAGREGGVGDYTYAELLSMRVRNNATNTEDVIVRFEDFLRYFSFRDLHFAIELKEQGTEQETLAMLSAFGMLGKTVVTSFRFCCIETVKRLCPSCKVGYLVPVADSNCLSELSRIGGEQVCPQAEHLTPDQVTDLHSRGYNVRAWGCSTIPLMRHALACGVDGMTVNFPDRLVKELGR